MYGNAYMHQQMMMMGYPPQYAPMMDPRVIAMMYAQPHMMHGGVPPQHAAGGAPAGHARDSPPTASVGAALSYSAPSFEQGLAGGVGDKDADGTGLNFLRASTGGSGGDAPAPAAPAASAPVRVGRCGIQRGSSRCGGDDCRWQQQWRRCCQCAQDRRTKRCGGRQAARRWRRLLRCCQQHK
jgi:hypothetical protein